jgi:hypothetical protein
MTEPIPLSERLRDFSERRSIAQYKGAFVAMARDAKNMEDQLAALRARDARRHNRQMDSLAQCQEETRRFLPEEAS